MARWQSGHAADCNSVYAGSIPTLASIFLSVFLQDWFFRNGLNYRQLNALSARMVELVDTGDLKSPDLLVVPVQVRLWAPPSALATTSTSPQVDPV